MSEYDQPQRAEPSYEVMFWQERDACERIQREMQSKIDDLRMCNDGLRSVLQKLVDLQCKYPTLAPSDWAAARVILDGTAPL